MPRFVTPEWLDELPADAPGAIGSRRDLCRLNALMGNAGLLKELLVFAMAKQVPRRIVELGAGDGLFALQLARRLADQWPSVELILLDVKPAMARETREQITALGWKVTIITAEVFSWLETNADTNLDLIFANLFLHQFSDADLARLIKLAELKSQYFAACEPRRGWLPWLLSKCVGLIGCNSVTRHDAPASVRAGFARQEISRLWANTEKWTFIERRATLFTHAFLARKKSALDA